jgi:flagellin
MPMVVQHNMSAINANNKMNVNVAGLKKSTEKLSSGYQINRAGDNAAGLAISEKMRSQIRGLSQATKNANDGISLIQTAEGGLNETHSILQRMRELAVQSANGTYTQEDRDAIQLEADALKSEIDRISTSTEFNTQQLLDGSLSGGGNSSTYGALYGMNETGLACGGGLITTTSSVKGMQVNITVGASGDGGENAVWDAAGLKVTVNLVSGKSYTDDEINDLIKNATVPKDAGMTAPYGNITFKSEYGVIQGTAATTTATASGTRGTKAVDASSLVADATNGGIGSSDTITFTANSYGDSKMSASLFAEIAISTDVAAGKENAEITTAAVVGTSGAKVTLHLATGVEYSEKDIQNILKEAGFDYEVQLTDSKAPDASTNGKIKFNVAGNITSTKVTEGTGVGKEFTDSNGQGLTFQIGANGVEDQRVTLNIDDMGADSLGVANVDVSDRDSANKAIDTIDTAISKVSMQRAGLGALQNRLEYTVNNLTTTNENLTNAESTIRDTDMATEMISYTKFNILQQASQAMLAQANQQPQAVLQLLG